VFALESRHKVAIVAICGIVILDSIALFLGIDGALLGTCIGTIAGIGGYLYGKG